MYLPSLRLAMPSPMIVGAVGAVVVVGMCCCSALLSRHTRQMMVRSSVSLMGFSSRL